MAPRDVGDRLAGVDDDSLARLSGLDAATAPGGQAALRLIGQDIVSNAIEAAVGASTGAEWSCGIRLDAHVHLQAQVGIVACSSARRQRIGGAWT